MGVADRKQNIQDWITQQWVILFGRKIQKAKDDWLLGPFGNNSGIGQKFIAQLANEESLTIDKNCKDKGLLQSIQQLNLPEKELSRLSKDVIDFYENTANYKLGLKVKWNPFFKVFGILLKKLFSNRLEQLNLPLKNLSESENLTNEIIQLKDPKTKEVKRTIWLRAFKASNEIVYSGVYETCKIPSGKTCIKATFPLPNGNATVILHPLVGENGELLLESSGKKFGDSGFYFLLKDSKGMKWSKYIKSFEDSLVVSVKDEKLTAIQTLKMWKLRVLTFEYNLNKVR